MIRRPIALLLALVMLHLTVARADAVCAMHHEAPATAHEGMDHGGAPAEKAPCDAPMSAEYCQTLASCAPVLSLNEALGAIAAPAIVPTTIALAVVERPLSRSTAPEPPPPKA